MHGPLGIILTFPISHFGVALWNVCGNGIELQSQIELVKKQYRYLCFKSNISFDVVQPYGWSRWWRASSRPLRELCYCSPALLFTSQSNHICSQRSAHWIQANTFCLKHTARIKRSPKNGNACKRARERCFLCLFFLKLVYVFIEIKKKKNIYTLPLKKFGVVKIL